MSYQLIHTSALHLLDSQASGYGTVARTEQMPQILCNKLGALSVFREPRGGAAVTGPQFSYHIIDHAGHSWHVLTCVQAAGADYSGRACHIAHHLVLSRDEVAELMENNLRPTPAGLILALANSGFWKHSWKGEPAFLTGEPELRPGDLPEADAQPTWKKLTGHKANARAFFTPPYHHECLLTVAGGTPVQEVLRLMHESDWLTHTRGWGITFTTAADDGDTYTETLRLVSSPDSPLVQRAIRTGHPVLHIEQGLEIPLPAPEPPESLPVNPAGESGRAAGLVRTVSRSVTHYYYTEEADWLLYDVGMPHRRTPWLIAAGTCLLLTGASIGIWHFSSPPPDPDSGYSTGPAVSAHEHQSAVQELTSLICAPYDHDHTQHIVRRISEIQEQSSEDTLLVECAALILAARQPGVRHAEVMKRLCECARLLGMKDTGLVNLYLREATHGIDTSDWQAQFTGEQLNSWIELKKSEPQLLAVLQQPDLLAYAPSAMPGPDPTLLATAETSATLPATEEIPPVQPGRVSLIPSPVTGGEALPASLEAAIPQLPLSITTGCYVVSQFTEGGSLRPAQRLELSPDGYRLYISPTQEPGVFSLTPEHKEGRPSELPAVQFSVKAGRLHSVRCGENEALVSFPVPENEQFHTNVILVPSFSIPLPQGKGINLPPAVDAGLEITPDMLEVQPPATQDAPARLVLKKRKGFPWELSRKNVERIRFNLNLPVLTGHNSVKETHDDKAGYIWTKAEVDAESEYITQFKCEVENRPDLPERLKRVFENVANSPCCGEAPKRNAQLTLGHLYYIACALANDKLTRKERQHLLNSYYRLFADKVNNNILCQIFAKDPSLILTRDEATGRNFKAVQARRSIGKLLEERQVRDRIRNLVCQVLTRSVIAAYTTAQQQVAAEKEQQALFTLKHIEVGNHVELIWHFNARQQDKKKP